DASEGTIILRREISSNGKSVCRINGKMMTLSFLKDIGRSIVDIHSQHEHQDLMQQDRHLLLLDSYGDRSLQISLENYHSLYKSFQSCKKQLNELIHDEKEAAQRLDLIRFQVNEIDAADLQSGEEEELEKEKTELSNYEKIHESLQGGYAALY